MVMLIKYIALLMYITLQHSMYYMAPRHNTIAFEIVSVAIYLKKATIFSYLF